MGQIGNTRYWEFRKDGSILVLRAHLWGGAGIRKSMEHDGIPHMVDVSTRYPGCPEEAMFHGKHVYCDFEGAVKPSEWPQAWRPVESLILVYKGKFSCPGR